MNFNIFTPSPSAPWLVSHAPLFSAAATFLAVLVALFRESVILRIRRPKLMLQAVLAPPQCALSIVRASAEADAAPAYYLRLWVKNEGRSTAKRVQVFVSKVRIDRGNGRFETVSTFLPMNLRWSHARDVVYSEGIAPQMGQYCEFGVITPPLINASNLTLLPMPLQVQTEARPWNGIADLPAGSYRFHLRVAASNAKPCDFVVRFGFTGVWHDEEATMFSDGVTAFYVESTLR